MKMAVDGGTLIIKDADNVQFTVIKSWNKMKWDKKTQTLRGAADLELLDKLSSIVRLPPAAENRRQRLRRRAGGRGGAEAGDPAGPGERRATRSAALRSCTNR